MGKRFSTDHEFEQYVADLDLRRLSSVEIFALCDAEYATESIARNLDIGSDQANELKIHGKDLKGKP